MAVKLIRLSTGEDLIGEITNEGDDKVTIENPCMVYVRGNNGGNASIGITKWLPYVEAKTIDIDRKWIVVLTDPVQDLVNEFNKVFGSGIITAPASVLSIVK